jgi:hypothetical protein
MDLLGSALHPLSALAPLLRRVGRWLEAGFAACFCHPLLALPLYLCTFPVAEIYFYSLGRRFSRRHQRKPHSVYSAADAREAARYWGTLCDTLVAERSVDESLSEDSGGWFGGAEGSPGRDRRRSRESRSSFEQREGVEAMLRGWFIGDSALSPRRDNVEDFLSWAIFNEDSASLDPSARAEVASLLLRCEEAMGRPLPPGREEGLVSMSYTLEQRWAQDAARQVHRLPLLVYLMLQLGDQALGLFLRGLGYRRLCSGRLEYWCRPALVPSPSLADDPRPPPPPPMVFLHGVLGLLPYPILLAQLCAHHTGAVLVPVFPHCSLRLDHLCAVLQERTAPHDASELASAVHRMLARHSPAGQHPRGTFLCHSLGSAHLASLLKRVPELVAGCAFVDPICFLMPDGHVLRNFLYGRREGADWSHGSLSPISWFHYAQTRFVCCEPTVQDYFRRCFWWGQCWLHPSEIGCDAIVLLSGHDTVQATPTQPRLRRV